MKNSFMIYSCFRWIWNVKGLQIRYDNMHVSKNTKKDTDVHFFQWIYDKVLNAWHF